MRKPMYRLLLAALLAAAVLAAPAVAQAHTLPKRVAVAEAWLTLDRAATAANSDATEYVSKITVSPRDCLRFSAHRFRCVGETHHETLDGYEYTDGTTLQICVANITVKFRSRYSYRLVGYVTKVKCF